MKFIRNKNTFNHIRFCMADVAAIVFHFKDHLLLSVVSDHDNKLVDLILVGNLSLAVNYNENRIPVVTIVLLVPGVGNPKDDLVAFKDEVKKGNLELVKLLVSHTVILIKDFNSLCCSTSLIL